MPPITEWETGMESRFKLFGTSVHQMLIVFPLGLLATAAVFDILNLVTGNPTLSVVAWYVIAAGVLGGLIAAPPGLIDWLAIAPGTRAKAIGALHGLETWSSCCSRRAG